ncbi:MAG TPA: hypothetical protein VMF52_08490 [Steroidobacteraceae bacterium]|nr:hypothetical protein [Steroidobacteraceae bacterium]
MTDDTELAARLRRLTGVAALPADALPFDYDGLLARQDARVGRAQRNRRVARATAGALVIAFVAASVWRLEPREIAAPVVEAPAADSAVDQPRLVRADTYLAVAALEEHIARVDDALNVARVVSPHGAEVARLERARNELLDSYAQVRYAELVSANF